MTLEFHSDGFPKMHTVLPDGAKSGTVEIQHVTPSKKDADFARLRAAISSMGGGRGVVREGETICQLIRNGNMWMSDTPDERRDHRGARQAVQRHGGHVLIGGLGLGMFPLWAALQENVTKVTVIEINPTVIEFVVPYLRDAIKLQGQDPDKLEVIQADLMEWKPPKGQNYEVIWFDIWLSLCTDNLPEMATLNRRFSRRTAGWRGCWGEELLKIQRERERERDRRWSW